MRAMTASGTVPSTIAGRTRWRSESRKAPGWSDRSASMVMKPVGWSK